MNGMGDGDDGGGTDVQTSDGTGGAKKAGTGGTKKPSGDEGVRGGAGGYGGQNDEGDDDSGSKEPRGEHFGDDTEGHFGADTGERYGIGGNYGEESYGAQESREYADQGGTGSTPSYKDGDYADAADEYAAMEARRKETGQAGQDEDPDYTDKSMNGFENMTDEDMADVTGARAYNPTDKNANDEEEQDEKDKNKDKANGDPNEEAEATATNPNKKNLPEFNIAFIKKNYKKLRDKPELKVLFDQLNIAAGSAISGACCGFDYLLTLKKFKYANPTHKLDAIVEIFLIEEGVISCLFQPVQNALDFALKTPAVKAYTQPILSIARRKRWI